MKLNRRFQVVAAAGAAILLLGLASWLRSAHQDATDPGEPSARQEAAPGGRFVGQEAAALTSAADRGESHLRQHADQIHPTMLMILDFLARRFDIGWMQAAAAPVRTPSSATPCADGGTSEAECERASAQASIRRLVDPSVRVTAAQIASLADPTVSKVDGFTFAALHCRTVPLPEDYPQRLAHWLDPAGDDYDPTHAALALQWALEQGCLDAGEEAIARLRALAIEQLVRFADGVPRDQPIEAVAMLGYLGARDRVERRWVDAIVAAQHGDGGWGTCRASRPATTRPSSPCGCSSSRPGRCTPDRGSRRARRAIARPGEFSV